MRKVYHEKSDAIRDPLTGFNIISEGNGLMERVDTQVIISKCAKEIASLYFGQTFYILITN